MAVVKTLGINLCSGPSISPFVFLPRLTPQSDVTETGPAQSRQAPGSSEPGSPRGSTSLLIHSASASGGSKEQGPGGPSDT